MLFSEMEDLDMLLEDLGRGKNTSTNARKARPLSSRVDLNELEDLMEDLAAPTTRQSTASVQSIPSQPVQQPAPTYNPPPTQPSPAPVVSPQPVQVTYNAQPSQGANPSGVYAVESRTSVVVDDLDSLMASLNATPSRASRRVSTRTPTQGSTLEAPSSPQPAPKQPVRAVSNDLSSSTYPVSQPQPTYNAQPAYNPQPTYNAQPAYNPQPTYNAQPTFPPQPTSNPQPTYNPQPSYQQPTQRPVSGAPGGELDSLLKDLNQQLSGMVNDSPYSKGTCWTCKQAILGEVVTAVGKTFHPEHFVCGNCRNPLGSGVFYEQGGVQHCERCFQELFCPRCGHCDKPVMDRCITAMGKKWHVEHFICTQCLRPFENGNFFERDGRPYCEHDFFNLFAPKCGGCGEPIRADSINALGVQVYVLSFCNLSQFSVAS